jgi:hypothetical protein
VPAEVQGSGSAIADHAFATPQVEFRNDQETDEERSCCWLEADPRRQTATCPAESTDDRK